MCFQVRKGVAFLACRVFKSYSYSDSYSYSTGFFQFE